jgi:hypothetical protein
MSSSLLLLSKLLKCGSGPRLESTLARMAVWSPGRRGLAAGGLNIEEAPDSRRQGFFLLQERWWWQGNHHHGPNYHLVQIKQPDMKKPRREAAAKPGLLSLGFWRGGGLLSPRRYRITMSRPRYGDIGDNR